MPDAIEQLRNATERDLLAAIDKLGPTHRRRLRDAMERYGSARAIPPEVWDSIKRDVDQQAAAILFLLFMGGYSTERRRIERQLSKDQRGLVAPIDEDRLRASAATAAARASTIVADDYVAAIRGKLEATIDDKAEEINQLPPRERARTVRQEIEAAVGADAAQSAVVTNTTRGMTAAQGSAADDIARQANVRMVAVWKREKRSSSCNVCRALDGKTVDQWDAVLDANNASDYFRSQIALSIGPPVHNHCQCSVTYVAEVFSEN